MVPFASVKEANTGFRTFEERRLILLRLLYGEAAKQRNCIPTKWLDRDSLIAAQSLVDSGVAKYDHSADGEVIRTRNWIRRHIPFGMSLSLSKLASQ